MGLRSKGKLTLKLKQSSENKNERVKEKVMGIKKSCKIYQKLQVVPT